MILSENIDIQLLIEFFPQSVIIFLKTLFKIFYRIIFHKENILFVIKFVENRIFIFWELFNGELVSENSLFKIKFECKICQICYLSNVESIMCHLSVKCRICQMLYLSSNACQMSRMSNVTSVKWRMSNGAPVKIWTCQMFHLSNVASVKCRNCQMAHLSKFESVKCRNGQM